LSWHTRILFVIIGVIVAVLGYSAWGIYAYSQRSYAIQADAAVVLGAAAWGEDPSPVFRERINHAITLYRDGVVRKIVFTGGQGDPSEPPEAIVAKRYALEHDVPEGDILVETLSRTTQQNLYYARQVARQNALNTMLIVSDPLHMKRAILIARDLGLEAYPSPTPTTRYRSMGSRLAFLGRETYFYVTYLLGRPFDSMITS
jgi:uncharacterized SAM-binding protein YcdF (DUF218 family)